MVGHLAEILEILEDYFVLGEIENGETGRFGKFWNLENAEDLGKALGDFRI